MAKVRIYDLGKELGVPNNEILEFLAEKGVEGKTASSSLDEDVAALVKREFGKTSAAPQKEKTAPQSAPKQEEKTSPEGAEKPEKKAVPISGEKKTVPASGENRGKKDTPAGTEKPVKKTAPADGEKTAGTDSLVMGVRPCANNLYSSAAGAGKAGEGVPPEAPRERPKKKASISAVYNPQHSQNGRGQSRVTNERTPRPAGERPPRPEGERPRRPAGPRPEGERPRRPAGPRPEGERPRRPAGPRPEGERPRRPAGPRPVRPEGERPVRPEGERPVRPEGERPVRPEGERPVRPEGERVPRPEGERPKKTQPKPEGEKNAQGKTAQIQNQSGDARVRAAAAGGSPDRDNRTNSTGRTKEKRGKIERVVNTPPKDAQKGSAGENRGKGSGGSGGGKNSGRKKKADYDQRSKKQENYVNLEKKTGHRKRNATPLAPGAKNSDEIRTIVLPEYLTVRELADLMKVSASEVVKKLFLQGVMATVNQEISYDKAEEIALEFNCIAEPEEKVDVIAELLKEAEEDEENMVTRPPVVCVMGHVDHGKTSLLDAIRNTRVTEKEAGGITQAIGASVVSINGQDITFLDTPGHEAFTAMRMRGANSTDIAILVVAADDGIMPQTVEAINHAKAAGVELIVAINKIDKPGADVNRVQQSLMEYDLVPESWGGSTICVPVSAKTGEGITDLLEMILLSAEVLELKADPKRNARGLVIEARLDKGRGPVATVLVQKGTLKVGQYMAAGSSYGRIRAMIDDKGNRIKEAGPSMPAEVLGLSAVPNAGEVFVICDTEKEARDFAETFVAQDKERLLEETRARMSLDDIFSRIQEGSLKELDLIVKADVQGSVEAVKQSLIKLSNDEVVVKVIHGGVGNINESDVSLAAASDAVIIGFNVKPDPVAKSVAEEQNVDIHLYNIIYKAIEDVEAAMKGMLDPIFEERTIGHAEIRQIFKASGVGNIAGSYVTDGVIERGSLIRLTRDGRQIYEGSLSSLKRFKDDVKEVRSGYECGLVFEGFNDIAEGDIVEAYKMFEIPR